MLRTCIFFFTTPSLTVDHNGKHLAKIAEGKIIFSFLPQIMPISDQVLETSSTVASRMEQAFEHLQSAWSLLTSMHSLNAAQDTHECDQTARAIQQAFSNFVRLFLDLESVHLRQFQIYDNELRSIVTDKKNISLTVTLKYEEEFKVKVLVDLFVRFMKLLAFDPASKHNPNSHMVIYVARFVEKFVQCLLKNEKAFASGSFYSVSRTNVLGLVYTLLSVCESELKSLYCFKQNHKFFLDTDKVVLAKSTPIINTQATLDGTKLAKRDEQSKPE